MQFINKFVVNGFISQETYEEEKKLQINQIIEIAVMFLSFHLQDSPSTKLVLNLFQIFKAFYDPFNKY